MNCREIRKRLFFAATVNVLEMPEVRQHVESCADCQQMAAGERLTSMMMMAKVDSSSDNDAASPFLMSRIRARISELNEQGAGSWESAILALRGWLFAFGAAAAVLLMLTMQWQSSPKGAMTRDHEAELSSISNVNEVLLSGNLPRPEKTGKEVINDDIDK